MSDSAWRPLESLRVLDFSRLLPGPYATLVLADLGARVDHVDDPNAPDLLALLPPHLDGEGAMAYGLTRNKRSIALDLKTPSGREAAFRLALTYDVVLESFRPGVMERLGLSDADLRPVHPRLIYCSISGYGQTGPDRLRAGHDIDYLARAGALASGGQISPGPPAPLGVQLADIGGGSLFAVVGILAALWHRERTGEGKHLDVSMLEGATAFSHLYLAASAVMGESLAGLRRGEGLLNGAAAAYRLYRTRDHRYLAVGALEPKFFANLCRVLGLAHLADQGLSQGDEGKRVCDALQAAFSNKTLAEWEAIFQGEDACVEPVREGLEVESDPQIQARGLFVDVEDEQRGRRVRHLRTPLASASFKITPPYRVGQHTVEILAEAGFSEAERQSLASALR